VVYRQSPSLTCLRQRRIILLLFNTHPLPTASTLYRVWFIRCHCLLLI